MKVDVLMDELSELLDRSWGLPLSGGKSVVDADKVRELINEIKMALPNEFNQAKAIVADRTQIVNDAKQEASAIIDSANQKSSSILSQSEVVKKAKKQANDIIQQAQVKARSLKKAANDYIDDLLKNTDDLLTKNLVDFRKARQNIRSSQGSK